MAELTPLVEPNINSTGIPINIQPTMIFSQAIEEGSVAPENFFIVSTKKEQDPDQAYESASITDIVPAEVEHRRIQLATTNDFTGYDFGTGTTPGELWRSEVKIIPDAPLKPNTNYAVIISDRNSLITVFDPQPGGSNSGSGELLAEGPYEGFSAEIYTVNIVSSGGKSTASYYWSRQSDGYTSPIINAAGKFTEIDRGLRIKFSDGTYDVSDSFSVNVRPEDRLNDLFSWSFGTALTNFEVPEDDESGDLINLPVNTPGSASNGQASQPAFYVEEVSPEFGSTMVRPARKGVVRLGPVIFSTNEETDDHNGWRFEFVDGVTAGNETISLIGSNRVEIQIEDEVSTAQEVVDAFNTSALAADFTAATSKPDKVVKDKTRNTMTRGAGVNQFIITFNKDINPATVDSNIRATTRDIYPSTPEEMLFYTTTVNGNTITLTFD